MADKIQLKALKRELLGKKVKKLRHEGKIPANIFGHKVASQAIGIDSLEFRSVYKQAGETSIIYLQIDGEKDTRPVLISNIQIHPFDRKVLHIDFRQVNLKEKITANVPLVLIGKAPVESLGAVILHLKDELEVEALPADLPEKIELDISSLKQMGDSLTVKDLKIDTAKIKLLAHEEELLVKAEEPKEEKVEEAAPVAEAEAEGAEKKEGEKKEGETEKKEEAKPEPGEKKAK
jgi:large subunit ribosomal protein L25